MNLRRLGRWVNLLVASLLMLVIWALVVWVASRPAFKTLIDLSPQGRGTIDPVTIELLDELAEADVQVEFHTFFDFGSQQAQNEVQRQMQRILQRLRELTTTLLRQYAYHGGDAVRVVHHDLYGDIAGTREAMQRFGGADNDVVIVAVQQPGRPLRHRQLSLEGDLGVVELPAMQQSPVPRAQVPILQDYKGEEALSSALKGLLLQGVPTVYFLNSNSLSLQFRGTTGGAYGGLLQLLDSLGFQVRELDLSRAAAVPRDAAMVAVLEPTREFASSEVRALHDYVRRGGRLLLNYAWASTPGWNPDGGELGRLLGFEVGADRVFHRIREANDPSGQMLGLDGTPRVSKLDLLLNPNHPITRRMALAGQLLQVDNARPLRIRTDLPAGVSVEPLLGTGPQGWLGRREPTTGEFSYRGPQNPGLHQSFTVGLVVEVDPAGGVGGDESGGDESGSDEPGRGDSGAGGAAGGAAAQPGHVVVISGVFANNLGLPINGGLAANVFNWLSERRVLLDIKGSRYEARHLDLRPQQLMRVWWFLVVAVPGLLLAAGLLVFWRRRQH